MHATPSGNHAVAVQRHAAQPANRKARPVVAAMAAAVAVVKVKVEAAAAAKAAAVPAQVPVQVRAVVQAALIMAAQAASNAHPAAYHVRFRPQAHQAPVHVRAAQRGARLLGPSPACGRGLGCGRKSPPIVVMTTKHRPESAAQAKVLRLHSSERWIEK